MAAVAVCPEFSLFAQKNNLGENQNGAKSEKKSNILRLEIEAKENLLTVGVPSKITITAHFKDGSPPQDITSAAKIKLSADLEIENGAITARKAGFHTLNASHERTFASAAFYAKNETPNASVKNRTKQKRQLRVRRQKSIHS